MSERWMTRAAAALTAAMFVGLMSATPPPAAAQSCGGEYVIKEGETLSDIAARVYGNPSQWTVIFYSNQDRLGNNVSLLVPGLSVRLPCIGAAQPAPQQAPAPAGNFAAPSTSPDGAILISAVVRRMELLTADGYAPYTGRALEGGGMLTQLMTSVMDTVRGEAKGRFDYGLSWVNDWAAHLNPLLVSRAFDVGFPWARPNCEDPAGLTPDAQFRCQRFFFSEPLYEVVTTTFVRNDSRLTALRTDEIEGKTFCRPTGYPIVEFDSNGRNWLKDGKIKLMRPQTPGECFRLLAAGTVDGIALAELVGRSAAAAEGMLNDVRELDPPLSLTTLHAIVSKSHPHARTMMYYVNAGLQRARADGSYDKIIERHLQRFWDAQARVPNPALGSTPAAAPKAAAQPAAAAPKAEPKAEPKSDGAGSRSGAPILNQPTATAKSEPVKK